MYQIIIKEYLIIYKYIYYTEYPSNKYPSNNNIIMVFFVFSLNQVNLVFNNDRSQTYTASYKPVSEGAHKVHVNFSGVPTPKSPYHVNVEASGGDPNKVNVIGPGIQPEGVFVNKPTYFEIHTKGSEI